MTGDHEPGATPDPLASSPSRGTSCPCGQELDTCTHRHCPRCGMVLSRAA